MRVDKNTIKEINTMKHTILELLEEHEDDIVCFSVFDICNNFDIPRAILKPVVKLLIEFLEERDYYVTLEKSYIYIE
jgi:hypothetical protein